MLKHLTRRIRRHWPRTRLTFRGDSHYGRTEAMAWCEDNGVDYIFGLAGNAVLHTPCRRDRREGPGAPRRSRWRQGPRLRRLRLRRRLVEPRAPRGRPAGGDDARLRRALHRHLARRRAPPSLRRDLPARRGQAENLIKLHKAQLASDRTSCQSPLANQFRLVLHTAAYWLMLALRDARAAQDAAPLGRVRNPPPEIAQDRRPRRREGRAHPHPLHLGLPRRRPGPAADGPVRNLGTLTAGAACPTNPSPFNPQTRHRQTHIPAPQRRRTAAPCALQTNRFNRPAVNTSG